MKSPPLLKVWPRQPFIGLGLAAVVGILAAEAHPHPSLGFCLFLPAALWAWTRRNSVAVYACVALAFFSLHSIRQIDSPGLRLAHEWGEQRQAMSVQGVVTTEPTVSARGMASFQLHLRWYERAGERHASNATVLARWRGDARYGDELQLFGVAQQIDGPRNPGEFDMRGYLARRDVRRALIVRYPENGKILGRGGGNPIRRAASSSRRWMQAALTRGLDDAPDLNGLINGMVLGLRSETPDEIEEQFQQTGTIHLFAASGLNVAIVALLLWTIARALRTPRAWASALIIPALFFYAAITGLNPSSVRAATMAAFVLGGHFFDRRVFAGNSIAAAAVLILCFDSNQLFAIGFQLSFLVVIALILWADPLLQALRHWFASDPFLPRTLIHPAPRAGLHLWNALARGASVSLAAWIGSVPLILSSFNLITPISLFANIIVVPIAFFVLAIGVMSLIVMPIAPPLAVVFNHANASLAAATLAVVDFFAHVPGGHFYLESPHRPTGAQVEIAALDLGAGAAVHVRAWDGDWLLDCGGVRDFKRVVRGYLHSRGINRLDGLLLTHGDSAHIGGAVSILRAFHPPAVVDSATKSLSNAHRALRAFLAAEGMTRELCAAPDELPLAKTVRARILYPPAGYDATNADDEALVLQLEIAGHWRVLLMSDSGLATEEALLRSETDLASDILIKGQHHSGISGSPEFLARVQPRLIIASSAEFPENERMKDDWAQEVARRGIKLFRQDQTGAVVLRFHRDRWKAIPHLAGETFASP